MAATLVYDGSHWIAAAVVAAVYFIMPLVFLPLRKWLGLPPIRGKDLRPLW